MIIYREKIDEKKKIYKYVDKQGNEIKDKKILDYINIGLKPIPPAYNNVRIYYEKSPKILFDGIDANGRLQQIYSAKWQAVANKIKFKALIDFGRKLPVMEMMMFKNIKSPKLTKNKVISIILQIVKYCGFRVGQLKYQKLYGSIGLSTLMKKHLTFKNTNKSNNGKELHIKFLGKKGVQNDCVVTDILIIEEMEKIANNKTPNDFLFVYDDEITNEKKLITAIDINNWLKFYNPEFTSKFFRTYAVNDMFINIMKSTKPSSMTLNQRKKKITEIIKDLSETINNTPAICKKAYLLPELIALYIDHPRKYESILIKKSGSLFIKFLESIFL